MAELSANMTLEIRQELDRRIGRFTRGLAAFATVVLAFSGVGLWQFLEQTQETAVIEATNAAKTAIDFEAETMIRRLAESEAKKLHAETRIENLLQNANSALEMARKRSLELTGQAEDLVKEISATRSELETTAKQVDHIKHLSQITNSIDEISKNLAIDPEFRKAVLGGIDPAPSGIIAAYFPIDEADAKEAACPAGWSPFSMATGRVILGAGPTFGELRAHEFGSIGGNETIQLTTAQLPSHAHALDDQTHTHTALAPEMRQEGAVAQGWPRNDVHFRFRSTDRGTGSPQARGQDFRIHSSALKRSTANVSVLPSGEGKEIETMPPYVALFFCRKD